MIFDVVFYCDGRPWKHYEAEFLPRVGDTIVDDMDAMYTVTEVEYCVPENGATYMKVIVYVES